jgi:hypothetical protein
LSAEAAVHDDTLPPLRSESIVTRRGTLAWLGGVATLAFARSVGAVEPEVPIRLQVSLLDRVIPFDRNFAVRVHGQLSVAVVVDATDNDSARVGEQLLKELAALSTLGNYPAAGARVTFRDTPALIEECQRLRAGVVYVAPGLREPIAKLSAALQGQRVLTVGSLPEDVKQGLVLGFAVRSGKPRVLVNLSQARQQGVDFRADFLRMAEVVG